MALQKDLDPVPGHLVCRSDFILPPGDLMPTGSAGRHQIRVKKTGFKDWMREITISGGTVNLASELAAK